MNAVTAGGTTEVNTLTANLMTVDDSDIILCIVSRSEVTVPENYELLYKSTPIETTQSTNRQTAYIYKTHVLDAGQIPIEVKCATAAMAFNFFACNIIGANNYRVGQVIDVNAETGDVGEVTVSKSGKNALIMSHSIFAHTDTVIKVYDPQTDCLLYDANARGHYIIDKSTVAVHKLRLGPSSGSAGAYKVWQTIVLNIS